MEDELNNRRKIYEVVWMHEHNEENWEGTKGGGMESPRPFFGHYKEAVHYCEREAIKTRAIIFEHRKIDEEDYEVVKDIQWGSWE